MEVVDIIDEKDRVLGQEELATAHEHGLLHRNTAILVFRDNTFREVLVCRRSAQKAIHPGLWATVGGHVWAGESYEQCMKRKLAALFRSGIPKGLVIEDLFRLAQSYGNDHEFVMVFRAVWDGPFDPDPAQIERIRFVDLDALRVEMLAHAEMYVPTSRAAVEAYLSEWYRI